MASATRYRKLSRAEEGAALRGALLAVLDGDSDRAENLLTRLVGSDSRDIPLYFALAKLFRNVGEVGRAIRVHQNLLLRPDLDHPQRLAALAELADDFRAGGFVRRAIASYEEVLERDPKHGAALAALVALHADVGDFDRALELERRRARAVGGDRADRVAREVSLWIRRADAKAAEGDNDGARRSLRKALRKDRSLPGALVRLGELEAERGKTKAALAAWQQVARIDPASGPQVYQRLEATFAAMGKSRDFEAYVGKLLAARPDDDEARIALARAMAARGAVDEAVSELRRVLDADSRNLRARIVLGRILVGEHRENDAAKELGQLVEALAEREEIE